MKKIIKQKNGITLIALVITIIVLLILAGVSISLLSGDNGVLKRAGEAKTISEKQGIIEQAKIDILGQQAENKGANITKEQLATTLNKYFETTDPTLIPDEVSSEHDVELTTIVKKYKINLSEIFKGNFTNNNIVETFGEKYEDSMIGKTINYISGTNNVTDWIILGKQVNAQGKNDILITTKNPISTLSIDGTLTEWIRYETNVSSACKNYVGETGTLGTKAANIVEVRSITLKDINNTVGFIAPETFDEFTFRSGDNDFENKLINYYYPNENKENPAWVKPEGTNIWKHLNDAYFYVNSNGTYKYTSAKKGWTSETVLSLENNLKKSSNMTYILANNTLYWVASRSVDVSVHNPIADFYVDTVGNNMVGRLYDCF